MEVELLEHQHEALVSNSKFTCLLSGVGGGKTFLGAHWAMKMATDYPHSLGLIAANSYGQLNTATLRTLFTELDRLNIKYKHNKSSGILNLGPKKFLCKSLDNYELLRGSEFGEAWIDEGAYAKNQAYEVVLGRLRDKKGALKALVTTTPKGFNWVYDYFSPSGEKNNENHRLIKARSTDNVHLPEDYIQTLRDNFDERLAQQEIDGDFVNLTQGKCYYAFDRKFLGEYELDPKLPLWVGLDFNVDPMTATICQVYKDSIVVLDEFYLRNSNTPELAEAIMAKYGPCNIVPDSTGTGRKTTGGTDFQLLKTAGHNVFYSRNPFVVDRINNVNRLFKLGRIKISSKCKKLINDLEKVSWKEGSSDIDKGTDKLLTHISDGFGYLAWYAMPMYEKRFSSTIKM